VNRGSVLPLQGRRILLIIAGGIAAYKSLDLIRRLRERGALVRVIMTAAAQRFVTPLAAAALSGDTVYTDLFSLTEESEMGHLRLAAEADLVVVAPATADLLARMAGGLADDLAATALIATDRPILVAPAMNTRMWRNPATRANLALLESRGVARIGPNAGSLAEGESGAGRMAEPLEIVAAAEQMLGGGALRGRRALVTSGPTHEAIDPVRYIANRSSGKQGHAIAAALARLGAETVLVSGPTAEPDPPGVRVVRVESARDMLAACEQALPADVAVCAAAVADWRAEAAAQKIKKKNGGAPPALKLVENPDILASLSTPGNRRPLLVVGFAAETEKVVEHAREKRRRKGCDWILANDVSAVSGTFGGDANTIHLVDESGVEDWPMLPKRAVAERLAERIARFFAGKAAP
jgi:phosphopantothenoylcysteine decarboxylase/phosphopantothenate--cysteine ligase